MLYRAWDEHLIESTLLMQHLVLRKIQAVAEGDIAGRIVTIIHCQFTGEPLLQIWQDLESHQPTDGRRHQFRDDERDQHAHVLRKNEWRWNRRPWPPTIYNGARAETRWIVKMSFYSRWRGCIDFRVARRDSRRSRP